MDAIISKNKKEIEYFYKTDKFIGFIFIIFLLTHLLLKNILNVSVDIYIEILKYEIIFIWGIFLIVLKKNKNWNHPLIILWGTLTFFNFFRILADVMGKINFAEGNFFKFYILQKETQVETLEITLLSIMGLILGILLTNGSNQIYFIENKKLKKISYIFMLSLGSLSFISSLSIGMNILRYGYEYLLSGNADNRNIFLRLSDEFFPWGYYLLLASKPSKKEFNYFTLIFVFYQLIELMKGARSLPFGNFLLVFSIYYYYYPQKLNIKKFIAIIIGILSLGSFLSDFRSGEKFNIDNLKNMLLSQTVTYTIIGQTVDYKKELENVKFSASFLEPLGYWKKLISTGVGTEQRTREISTRVLADNLAYALNKNMYLSGFGLGTNPMAEVYLKFKKKGSFMLFFLMGIFLQKLIKLGNKNNINKFIMLIFLPYIFLIGRNSYFFIDITKIIKIIIFVILIKILKQILWRK